MGRNVNVRNNSARVSVYGNVVDGNLEIHSNKGRTDVISNAVSGKMFCHNNASVAGGPNVSSANVMGQCSQTAP